MDWTLNIAIYGAVVSTFAIFLQLIAYYSSTPSLKISNKFNNAESFVVSKKDHDFHQLYNCAYVMVVSLRITNKSSRPDTILSVHIKTPSGRRLESRSIIEPEYLYSPNPLSREYYRQFLNLPKLSLPRRLEPYDTVFGFVSIPFVDEICDKEGNIPSVKVYIETSRTTKSITLSVPSVKLFSYLEYNEPKV